MRHFPSVLESIRDLTKEQVDGLLALAKKFKSYSDDWQGLPIPFIRTPVVTTLFLEDSTRTKYSFAIAIKKMGGQYIDFQAHFSGLNKGEELDETLATLGTQGVDLCIIRTGVSHQLTQLKLKAHPPLRIVNGGDGIHQHPTQALLDLFTMLEIGLEVEGKTVAIIGDVVHSRVANSLLDLLPWYGVKILLCGPPEFLPEKISSLSSSVEIVGSRDEALANCDLAYLLRIQKERHKGKRLAGSTEEYARDYGVDANCLKRLGKKIPLFHPGPANVGVEIARETMNSPAYFGHLQVRNSIYMRMAVMQAVLQNNDNEVGVQFYDRKIEDL